MKCNIRNKDKLYHTVALSPEVILSLKKLGSMGDSYNSVITRLLEIAGSVGAKEDKL